MPSVVGLAAVLHVAILSAVGHTATGAGEDQAYWLQYPHARREMLRELIFLSPIAGLAMVGGWAAHRLGGPWEFSQAAMQLVPAQTPPAWLMVLAGVLLGYLVGGGIVWMVRILGSLAFNKEAMGLGDVHLLAAVGACLGWIDAVGAFFAAVVVGAVWGVLGSVLGGSFRRMLPFGPFLVLGTLMVWFAKQGLIEWAVNAIAKPAVRIHLP
jgi:leader peptidase (prepilin peptidase)/N-methyltransferase